MEMRIGELAERAGVNAPTIRYYEEVRVMPPPQRAPNGYRIYDEADLARLHFISRARDLDFSLEEIGEILDLREWGKAPCAYVLAQIEVKLAEIELRMQNLAQLRTELQALRQTAKTTPPQALATRNQICHLLQNRRVAVVGPCHIVRALRRRTSVLDFRHPPLLRGIFLTAGIWEPRRL